MRKFFIEQENRVFFYATDDAYSNIITTKTENIKMLIGFTWKENRKSIRNLSHSTYNS